MFSRFNFVFFLDFYQTTRDSTSSLFNDNPSGIHFVHFLGGFGIIDDSKSSAWSRPHVCFCCRGIQLAVAPIGILHFRDHWTGIIAPSSSPFSFPLLHWGSGAAPKIHDLLNITHQRFKLKSIQIWPLIGLRISRRLSDDT